MMRMEHSGAYLFRIDPNENSISRYLSSPSLRTTYSRCASLLLTASMHGLRSTLATKLRRNSNGSWVWRLQLMLTVDPSNEACWVGVWILRPVGSYEISVYRPELRKRLFWTSSSVPVFSVAVNPRSGCIVLLPALTPRALCESIKPPKCMLRREKLF